MLTTVLVQTRKYAAPLSVRMPFHIRLRRSVKNSDGMQPMADIASG